MTLLPNEATAEQFAIASALALRGGYKASAIVQIYIADNGDVGSIYVDKDNDGMAIYILNFSL